MPGGRTALYTFNSAPHTGNLQVNLVAPGERTQSDVVLMEKLRGAVREKFPGVQLFFSSGGIVKRIVNMGTPAPIDVEILGQDVEAAAAYARARFDEHARATSILVDALRDGRLHDAVRRAEREWERDHPFGALDARSFLAEASHP